MLKLLNRRWAAFLLIGAIGLIGMGLTFFISSQIQRTLGTDQNQSFQRSLEVYVDLKFRSLQPYIEGYTHWSDLTTELSDLEIGAPLSQEMSDSWLSGNADVNDGVAILRDGNVVISGGLDWEGVKSFVSFPDLYSLAEQFSTGALTDPVPLLLSRGGKVLFLLAGPFCDDLGNISPTSGMAIFSRFWGKEDGEILGQLTQSELQIHPSSETLKVFINPTSVHEKPHFLYLKPLASPQEAVKTSLYLGFLLQALVLIILSLLFVGAMGSLRRSKDLLESQQANTEDLNKQFVSLRDLYNGLAGFSQEFTETVEDLTSSLSSVRDRMGSQALESMTLFQQSVTLVGKIEEAQNHLTTISRHINDSLMNLKENSHLTDSMQKKTVEMVAMTEKSSIIAQDLQQESLESSMELEQTVRILEALALESRKITEVVEVIEDIAARTNLLSINAAIESARAGAGGRGFGVVAEEIRKLASSTAQNSQSIRGRLESISQQIQEAASKTGDLKVRIAAMSQGAEQNLGLVFDSADELKNQGRNVQDLVVSNHLILSIAQELEIGITQESSVLVEALLAMHQFEGFNSKGQVQSVEGLEMLSTLLSRMEILKQQFSSGLEFIEKYGELVNRED